MSGTQSGQLTVQPGLHEDHGSVAEGGVGDRPAGSAVCGRSAGGGFTQRPDPTTHQWEQAGTQGESTGEWGEVADHHWEQTGTQGVSGGREQITNENRQALKEKVRVSGGR